ncbi:NAD(P)H-binding protein [Microbacterium sp. X-17]|uniref:SDR family oxidoreductase n=1 Tax=Microbacterium sp. X-17 TaxID=3144404 RepID=UPI0031F4C5B7
MVGSSGRVGKLVMEELALRGHSGVAVSRSAGIDVLDITALTASFSGVDAVIDVTNTAAATAEENLSFFGNGSANISAAARRSHLKHHVVLSIVGVDRIHTFAHYLGKQEQERHARAGSVPWTIVRATQFHDFAEMVAEWGLQNGSTRVAPLLVQPIAPVDVARALVDAAEGEPQNQPIEIAGPRTEDLVDMARRTFAARGKTVDLIPTWRGALDESMAGEVLLPSPTARLFDTTFEQWVSQLLSSES